MLSALKPLFFIPGSSAQATDAFSVAQTQYDIAMDALTHAPGDAFNDDDLSIGFLSEVNKGLALDELVAMTENSRPQIAPSVFVFSSSRIVPRSVLISSGRSDGGPIKVEGGVGANVSGSDDVVVSRLVEKMNIATARWIVEQERSGPMWRISHHLGVGMAVRNAIRILGLAKYYDDNDIELDNVWADVLLRAAQKRLENPDVDHKNLPEPKFTDLLTRKDYLAFYGATEEDYKRAVQAVIGRYDRVELKSKWDDYKEFGMILGASMNLISFLTDSGFGEDFAFRFAGEITLDVVKQIWGE